MVRLSGLDGWRQPYAFPASAEARGALLSPSPYGLPFAFAVAEGVFTAAHESFKRDGSLYAAPPMAGPDIIPASQAWRASAGRAVGLLGVMSHIEGRGRGWQLLALQAIHDVLRHRFQGQGALTGEERECIRSLFRALAWPEPTAGAKPRYWDRWALSQLERALNAWQTQQAGGTFREWGFDTPARSGKREIFWNWGGSLYTPSGEGLLWLHATYLLRSEAARALKSALAGGLVESLGNQVSGYWQWNNKVTPNLLKSRAGHALAYSVAASPSLTYLLDLMGFSGRAYAGLDANVRMAVAQTGPRRSLGHSDILTLSERFFFEGYNILQACRAAGAPVRLALLNMLESETNSVRALLGQQPTYAYAVPQPRVAWATHR